MSVESISRVLNNSRAKGTTKLVLIGIANHDGDGGSWPSIATLARYAGISERQVQKHINKLIALGELERIYNEGGTRKTPEHMRPNLYRILTPGVVHDTGPGVVEFTGPVSYSSPEPSLEPSIEPSKEPVAEFELEGVPLSSKKVGRKAPSFFKDEFVTQELLAWAKENTPGVDTKLETLRLKVHFEGQKKSDWVRTWKAWMVRSHGYAKERAAKETAPPQRTWQWSDMQKPYNYEDVQL